MLQTVPVTNVEVISDLSYIGVNISNFTEVSAVASDSGPTKSFLYTRILAKPNIRSYLHDLVYIGVLLGHYTSELSNELLPWCRCPRGHSDFPL